MPLSDLLILCKIRLASFGLISGASDPTVQASLEHSWSARIAPAWLTDAAVHGARRKDLR